jgi:cobalt-zinc-cadmium resistance protein CzcA
MKHQLIYLLTAVLIFPAVTGAQEKEQSLQECIRVALANNRTMQSGRIAIEQAKDLQGTAFNIGRTSISWSQEPVGASSNSLSLSQDFDFPTVYLARRGLLEAETGLARSQLEVTRNELVRQIAGIYYQLLFTQENIRLLQEQDSIYRKFVTVAAAKCNAGESSRLELINAEQLYSENRLALQKAETVYRNAQLDMQRWLNTGEWIKPVEPSLPVIETPASLPDFDPGQTPVNRVFESKKTIGEKNLRLAGQGFLPGFNAGLRNQYLELGITLPLFFGEQRAKTKAAKREIERIQIQQEEALASLSKEYQIAVNEYTEARNALDYYRAQGKEQAREISRIAQLAYEKGEIGYTEYILNLKTAIELHLQYASAVNEYNQTVITINYLHGNQ